MKIVTSPTSLKVTLSLVEALATLRAAMGLPDEAELFISRGRKSKTKVPTTPAAPVKPMRREVTGGELTKLIIVVDTLYHAHRDIEALNVLQNATGYSQDECKEIFNNWCGYRKHWSVQARSSAPTTCACNGN